MRTRFLATLILGGCAGSGLRAAAPGDALTFEGRVERAPLGLSAAELARLPRVSVKGRDPSSDRRATYTGFGVAPLVVDALPLKRGADLVVFHGAGGTRAAVPVNAIRQVRPVLADEVDGKRTGEGGGFLLAWPDAEAPGLETDPRVRWWWLHGVKRVELVSWQQADGRALRVPPGASDEARTGADAFATSCMICHRVRGQGGTAGPELTGSPLASDPGRLTAALPGHLAARSGFPSTPDLPAGTVRQIAAFLRAVAIAGTGPPDEEVKEQEPPLPPAAPRRP